MKIYEKKIDGKTVRQTMERISICRNGMRTVNPTEEMLAEDGWTEYDGSAVEPTAEELLAKAKAAALKGIACFDGGKRVNNCMIRKDGMEFEYWADKHERDSLKNAVRDCISLGREMYRLDIRELEVSVEIPCEALQEMLSRLEVYAIDCYNKTTDHIYAVKAMASAEEVEAYDYRAGYPDNPVFELDTELLSR